MNAGYIVYAFLGEVMFAVITAGAVLILAALLKVTPLKTLRRHPSGSHGRISIRANARSDRPAPKVPVIDGVQAAANDHRDDPAAAAIFRSRDMQPHM